MTGFGDLVPQFALRWNEGVHNYMAYVTGNIPVGRYDQNGFANLGIGHQRVDAGGGYTYFNPQTGYEFSSVVGLTYNFENTHTQYQNGVDLHWTWAPRASSPRNGRSGWSAMLYQQLSCDSGAGDRVGCFKSRVLGIGPQIGHVFQVGELPGLCEPQGLQGIRRRAPAGRLERVAHVLDLAGGAGSAPPATRRRVVTK